MNIKELSVPAFFSNEILNPLLWEDDELILKVRYKLLQIAKNFIDTLKVKELNLTDITISGSNVGYNYSDYSDIDLHIIVDAPDNEELEDYFDAKKSQYNFKYDLKIKEIPVEVYVQKSSQPHVSAGVFSVLDDKWLRKPSNKNSQVNEKDVKAKARNYSQLINKALKSRDLNKAIETMGDIRRLRKAGLEAGGENSVENLAFKLLRNRGQISKLSKYIDKLHSQELSLGEHMKINDIIKEDGQLQTGTIDKIEGENATFKDMHGHETTVPTSAIQTGPDGKPTIEVPKLAPGEQINIHQSANEDYDDEEKEEESDVMAFHKNLPIGGRTGDKSDEYLYGGRGHGVIDKEFERSARGEMSSKEPTTFSPIANRLAESDELYKWLTIAGIL